MESLKKSNLRSHLLVVVDNLSSAQLSDLGKQIKKLPVPPIVTLIKSVPIHDSHQAEEVRARQALAKAKQDLNFHASTETIFGSNPKIIKDFFVQGIFDALIGADRNNRAYAIAKNAGATGMKELIAEIPVTHLVPESSISAASYKPVFTPLNKSRAEALEEEKAPAAPTPAPALKR